MEQTVFAVCVAWLLSGRTAVWASAEVPSSSLRVLSAAAGKEAKLECVIEDDLVPMIYWYKQKIGEEPKMVSRFYRYETDGQLTGEFQNNTRVTLETSTKKNHLKISNVQLSDTATYFCVSSISLIFEFLEGITVIVEDSSLISPGLVYQSGSERIPPGQPVTLRCSVDSGATCDEERRVYWLKDAQPGLIYTQGGECEKNTPTSTCVYNLTLEDLDRSNAGTYYCAVAACGHILFGNGTKLEIEDDGPSLGLIRFLSGLLALTIVLVAVLACATYRVYMKNSRADSGARRAAAPNTEGRRDADDLHYAALKDTKRSRLRRRQDDSWSQCVYSSVNLSS